MDEKLAAFIDHARDRGLDYATIRQLLLAAGWQDKAIAESFGARELKVPIPQPAKKAATRPRPRKESVWPRRAREAFFHLLTFGALYACVTSLIGLFFTYLDFSFPDPAWRTSYAQLVEAISIIRVQLAVVIVTAPIFLILWHFLLAEVRRDSEKAKGAIRRWLIYLSLFIGALTLSGDVMTLIYLLLEGQLTTRVILKSSVLFLIAGSLVLYFALTLRSEATEETES